MDVPSTIGNAFRWQAEVMERLGAPGSAGIVRRCAEDVERGGPVAALVAGWRGRPIQDALALRLLGAVHAIVLEGRAPAFAEFCATAGGARSLASGEAWQAFRRVLEEHAEEIRPALDRQVQTNEVRRSAPLLAGFLHVAREVAMPLRVLEIGCSAGLNLRWDRYGYEFVATAPGRVPEAGAAIVARWGAIAEAGRASGGTGTALAPVAAGEPLLRAGWSGPADVLATRVAVVDRAGCDLSPIDLAEAGEVRRLESFVWSDQPERMMQLRRAIEVARREPVRIDRCGAGEWLERELAAERRGVATVVFQSVMWSYLGEAEQERVRSALTRAGERAGPEAPLAWMRFEPAEVGGGAGSASGAGFERFEVRVKSWPGEEGRVVGWGDPHGRWVEWRG